MLATIEEGERMRTDDGREEVTHMLPVTEQMDVMIDLPQRDCAFTACGHQWYVYTEMIRSDHRFSFINFFY